MRTRKYTKLLWLESIALTIALLFGYGCNSKHLAETSEKHRPEQETQKEYRVIQPIDNEIRYDQSGNGSLLQFEIGIQRMELYLDSLRGKRIAIVANQSSVIGTTHLVDTLLSLGIQIQKVFAPEHGFRGTADAGEKVWSHKDPVSGLPIVSLYGSNKKPRADQLFDVDLVLFDIQDVGVRFYTYISTLHYVMEACAENNKTLIVLDRPNPNAHYVDGPILEADQSSFIGMHPVPIVYGMTIGEYALMINGEFWLKDHISCRMYVVPCKGYTHKTKYEITVPPSPNLRTDLAINLYPSLCLFEATTVSIGRGTERPFEMYGHPKFSRMPFEFIPMPTTGAKDPLWQNQPCFGYDLATSQHKRLYELKLSWLLNARDQLGDSVNFIDQKNFFDHLAGTSTLRKQIMSGMSEREIKATWQPGLDSFKAIRARYLIYK